jgi:CheY-like chemotaxis protein
MGSVNWIMRVSCSFTSFGREDSPMGLLTAREAAQQLHISLFTLGRIEKEGLLVPFRTPGGHRRYSLEMLNEYLEHTRTPSTEPQTRILIVDDGNEVVESLSRALPTCSFASAHDELHIGIKLGEFKPDLVLVKATMRDMDGQELCRRLNAQDSHLKALPFNGPEEAERSARDSMMDSLHLDGLHTSIAAALGLQHGRDTG